LKHPSLNPAAHGQFGQADGKPVPRTVGIWLEFSPDELPWAMDDEGVRLARNLAAGLGTLPEIERILVPCQPAACRAMAALFADPARPGRLVADTMEIIPAGSDRRIVDALGSWVDRRRRDCQENLGGMYATPNPASWLNALGRLRDERLGRPRLGLASLRRVLRLARSSVWFACLGAVRFMLDRLPSPHAAIAADLRRRGIRPLWIITGTAATRVAPALRVGEPQRIHAAGSVAARRDAIPLVPAATWHDGLDDEQSRQLLARELRDRLGGGANGGLHRHFCDFPFERIDYILACVHGRSWQACSAVLRAYAQILRRQRRDVKLILSGRAVEHHALRGEICAAGLVFDVVEIDGLPEESRARLIRHALAVVVPPHVAASPPSMFSEAVTLETPVVLGRRMAAPWLAPEELAGGECFDDDADPQAGLAGAILHAIDRRDDVLTRQGAILVRLARRTWADVAKDCLASAPPQ